MDLFQYISHFAIQPEGEELTGGWKKLHSDKLHNLYSLATARVIKSRTACSMAGRDEKYRKNFGQKT
jgi:hypothetical protein